MNRDDGGLRTHVKFLIANVFDGWQKPRASRIDHISVGEQNTMLILLYLWYSERSIGARAEFLSVVFFLSLAWEGSYLHSSTFS